MEPHERIRALELVLTAGCNLTCSYCYQNDKKPLRMQPDIVRAAVDLLTRSRRRTIKLILLGGEPLLAFDLFRLAVEYAESVRPRGKRLEIRTSTNGTLLDSERTDYLVHHDVYTQLSFDGVPAAQDERGRGTFAKLDRLVDRLRIEHPAWFRERLSVAVTVHAAALPYLADSVSYFLRKGVRAIDFTPLSTHDPGWTHESMPELDAQFARIFRATLRHYRRTGDVPLTLFRKSGRAERPQRRGATSLQMCGAGSLETIAVDVDGQSHGCVLFASSYQRFPSGFLQTRFDSMRLGNPRDDGFSEGLRIYPEAARRAGIFDEKEAKYSSYGRCGECRYLDSCVVCPTSIGFIPGNDDPRRVPDSQCAWNLVTCKYAERFPRQPDAWDRLTGRAPLPGAVRELLAFVDSTRASGGPAARK